jgi:hypothetical protein
MSRNHLRFAYRLAVKLHCDVLFRSHTLLDVPDVYHVKHVVSTRR